MGNRTYCKSKYAQMSWKQLTPISSLVLYEWSSSIIQNMERSNSIYVIFEMHIKMTYVYLFPSIHFLPMNNSIKWHSFDIIAFLARAQYFRGYHRLYASTNTVLHRERSTHYMCIEFINIHSVNVKLYLNLNFY